MYVKLFASILDSSIWSENYPTRLVWITMLAMADAEGIVKASASGVARRAAVTRKEADAAIAALLSPDKDRPNQPHDGRRLELLDGGWLVLNYEKYREIRTQQQLRDAIRQRKHREKSRTSRDTSQHAEAYAEADTEKPPTGEPLARARWAKELGKAWSVWTEELGEAWSVAYGGLPPFGRIGKSCKALVVAHGLPEVLTRWQNYLGATQARYASPSRFAETYGSWEHPGGAPATEGRVSEDDAATAFRLAGLDLSQTKPKAGGYDTRAALERAIQVRKAAGVSPLGRADR